MTGLELLEANGGSLKGKKPPEDCTSKHLPLVTCSECGNRPPRGGLLDFPSTPREMRWRTWYHRSTFTTADPSTTTPEWRAEIEKATEAYQLACEAYDRAGQAHIAAVLRERLASRVDHFDPMRGGLLPPDQGVLSRAEIVTDATHLEWDRAEKALRDALRELNRVSLAPSKRQSFVDSLVERLSRRMVFG